MLLGRETFAPAGQMTTDPIEIDAHAVAALRTTAEPFLLLDCREPDEYAIARIEGAVLIPMQTIPERLTELEPHRTSRIVVHCHHGVRSLRVARFLRERGFTIAQSMAGGIEAWAVEIDPAMPRY
jgi:rhodanese-related sulfurtransferase